MQIDNHPKKELLDVETFLEIYSISRNKFYSQVNAKKLILTKLGSRSYVKRSHAEEWLENLGKIVVEDNALS